MIPMSAAANKATPTNSRRRRETVDPFTSNLHDDRQHKRPATGTLPEETAQLDAELFLDDARIGTLLETRLIHHVGENSGALGQQRLAVFHHEAARDDVG